MMWKSTKQAWNSYIRSNQNITACIIALFAFLVIFTVLFQNPRPGVMDFGEYVQVLNEMGLNWTNEDLENTSELQFVKVIEHFQILDTQEARLLQVEPTQSLIYPVSFIKLVCVLLGIQFSTLYLAILLTVITVFCIYSIVKSLYCYFKQFAAVIGFVLCFVLLGGTNIIYFNSLYSDGIFFVSLLIYLTVLLKIPAKKEKGIRPIVELMLASLFLLNAKDTGVFLLPAVILISLVLSYYCRPKADKLIAYSAFSLFMLLLVTSANVRYTMESSPVFSQTNLYHALFTGILESTDEPEEILKELGLSQTLAGDIGKSAYLAKTDYVVYPYGDKAKAEIFDKFDYPALIKTYLKHPDIYIKVLEKTAGHAVEVNTEKFLYSNRKADEGTEWVERFIWWKWVRTLLIPTTAGGYFMFFFLSLLIMAGMIVWKRKNKELRTIAICFLLVVCMTIIEYLTCYAYSGFAEADSHVHSFIISCDIILVGLISAGIYLVWKMVHFLKIQNEEMLLEERSYQEKIDTQEVLNSFSPLTLCLLGIVAAAKEGIKEKVLKKPKLAGLLFSVVSLLLMVWILFYPRIGSHNNGDFERMGMMSAMNIEYTADEWKTPEELSLTKVVENYDWVKEYDYTKIMFYNADLTQAWMSFALKLVDNYIGLNFSTIYVTIIYVMLLTVCIYTIMRVLFERFGYRWIWVAIPLLFILLDTGNLGWFNSLFGEGPAFVGLMMVTASGLSIASKEKGHCTLPFLGLLFSVNFFAGSKGQFTVTIPVLLILIIVLAIYHCPEKIWSSFFHFLMILSLSLLVLFSVVKVYQNNDQVSSPDTIYQSIFYGALMISEDPKADLLELGLQPEMVADIGKHAYLDKSEYYCAPRTKMAEELIYSKVNTFTMLKFYLHHPDKLWTMLNVAATAAAAKMPDFVIYVGQKTTEPHDTVNKFRIWEAIRLKIAVNQFWELLIIYMIVFCLSARILFSRKFSGKDKMMVLVYLAIVGVGVIQFPLTVIGNGFADNTKQLYLYRVTYDITIVLGSCLLYLYLKPKCGKLTNWLVEREKKRELQNTMKEAEAEEQ